MRLWVEEYFGYYGEISEDTSKRISKVISANIFPDVHLRTGPNRDQLRDQLSETFTIWIQNIAGRGLDWWPLIEDGETRKFLVLALLAEIVADYVFGPMLFGATLEQKQALMGFATLLQEHGVSDERLQKWISLTVRLMFPSTSSIPCFITGVNEVTLLFQDMVKPLLSLTPELDPFLHPFVAYNKAASLFSSSQHTRKHFTQALRDIFQAAAELSYEMREEPDAAYTLDSIRPGMPYDPAKMISRYETSANASLDPDGGYKPLLVRFSLFPALVRHRDGPDGDQVLMKPEVVVFQGVLLMGVEEEVENEKSMQQQQYAEGMGEMAQSKPGEQTQQAQDTEQGVREEQQQMEPVKQMETGTGTESEKLNTNDEKESGNNEDNGDIYRNTLQHCKVI